jgi:hypothetical protein
MSVKTRVLAAVAALAAVGGIGTAGVLGTAATAHAATPSCGPTCIDILGPEFGHHHSPGFLLDVFQAYARLGQPIILFRASSGDPAEDFRAEFQGTVLDFYRAGLVSAAFAQHYGCVSTQKAGTGDFSQCYGCVPTLKTASPVYHCYGTDKSLNDPAFEIEYAPDGVDSGLCVGVASAATQAEGVTLQECGASSRTVWAIDLYDQPFESLIREYVPLINGSDTIFSAPFALTYPFAGYPTDKPHPQLQVDNLSGYTTGFPPILDISSVDDVQLWGADRLAPTG